MNDATQTGVAMAAIGMIGTVVGVIVGYFRDRDKLQYDVRLVGLQTQNTAQATKMAEQDTEIAELKRSRAECVAQHNETSTRLAAVEKALNDHLNRGTAQKPALQV